MSDGEATASSFLQAIAAMRIVLKAVAEELHAEAVGEAPNAAMAGVVQRAAAICEACQGKDRGPFMHLLKCLLQAHGRHALLEIAAQAEASHGPFAAMISEVVVVDPELPADQLVVQLQPGTAAEPYDPKRSSSRQGRRGQRRHGHNRRAGRGDRAASDRRRRDIQGVPSR